MINIQITIEWIHKLNNMKVDKKNFICSLRLLLFDISIN